jgi:hypothetical protein
VRISSVNGQVVHSSDMEGTTYQLDLSSYRKGVYLITIRSKDLVIMKKIVKM